MLLIVLVFAIIFSAVGPRVNALSMQLILRPSPFVLATVWPVVAAVAFNCVLVPLSYVVRLIGPLVLALSLLLPAPKITYVRGPILEHLNASTVLKIVYPLSFVGLA